MCTSRLSRGKQVRFTMVLGDGEIDNYLDDLVLRRKIYQELIDAKIIELTTNSEYEHFVAQLDHAGVADGGRRARWRSAPDAYRRRASRS